MAYGLPGSQFVGIDLSPRQIDDGRRTVAALGLTNIDLRPASVFDVDEGFGRFDYVICHGVYSWVAAEVREQILAVCQANLAADGVAYVSYNTYPGWHLRGRLREMMLYHVRPYRDPGERVRQARALVAFLVQTAVADDSPYGSMLRYEDELLGKFNDADVYHEYLEEVNEPVYLHQFAERAAARGLQYLGEADPTAAARPLSAEALATLRRLSGSRVQLEQYIDFVVNRAFRRTLLCHEHVGLRHPPSGEAIMPLYLTGLSQPVATTAGAVSEGSRGRDGGSIPAESPQLRAALRCLSEAWPAALSFEALWERVRDRGPHAGGDGGRLHLAEALLQCYAARMVDLHLRPPALAARAGERPRASALARLQAAAGQPLCNLRHGIVVLEPFDRLVLQQLDGTRGRPTLVEALAGMAASGAIAVGQGGAAVRDPAVVRDALRQALGASLDRIARCALLDAAEDVRGTKEDTKEDTKGSGVNSG
jgi:methyltransferase-like protein